MASASSSGYAGPPSVPVHVPSLFQAHAQCTIDGVDVVFPQTMVSFFSQLPSGVQSILPALANSNQHRLADAMRYTMTRYAIPELQGTLASKHVGDRTTPRFFKDLGSGKVPLSRLTIHDSRLTIHDSH